MLLPSDLLVKKLDKLRIEARARHRVAAAETYAEAIKLVPTFFRNRGFGEAVPIASKAFQVRASNERNEEAKQTWLRCVTELQQVVNDLS